MSDGSDSAPTNPEPFDPFELHSSEQIYDSPWCGLRRDMVVLPNGALQEYHVFEISDASVVVPLTEDDRIVMVGQYRYPHGKTHWEVPAGRIATDESPRAAAERELLEETGFAVGTLQELPGFYPTNGISAHFAHAFVARGCRKLQEPELDAAEQLIVRTFSRDEARALLRAGRIEDGFTAIVLMYVLTIFE